MKNNAIFARKCEINYQMWIKKCKSGKVSYCLLSYKWRNFQLVNFITICCTTLPRIASHTAHFVCLLSNRGPQNKPRLCLFVMGNSGGTSCPNDDRVIGPCNLVTERERRGLLIQNSKFIIQNS